MKKILLICFSFIMFGNFFSQTNISKSNVLDGVYVKKHIPTSSPISYTPVREADVLWEKKVWRILDYREKLNYPIFFPHERKTDRFSLWDVIVDGIVKENMITPYEITGDGAYDWDGQFLFPVTPPNGDVNNETYKQKLDALLFDVQDVPKIDPETGEPMLDENGIPITFPSRSQVSSKDIIQYYVKEHWFFDRQRSVLDQRIIGICPVKMVRDERGEEKAPKPLFWLHFQECRYLFSMYEVFNENNETQRMSFDDIFWKRRFSSYIYKETNNFDREIREYEQDGIKALLIGQEIENDIMDWEHDLWSY